MKHKRYFSSKLLFRSIGIVFILFICCWEMGFSQQRSHQKKLAVQWRPIKGGLYLNNKKEVGYKISVGVGQEAKDGNIDIYMTKLDDGESTPLNKIIDTATFKNINNAFYKDKNHVYRYYGMVYGGTFNIYEEGDPKSFKSLGRCYARDKNHVYENRSGIIKGADLKTFKSVNNLDECVAKDKFGYFQWHMRITKEELKNPQILTKIKAFERELQRKK